MTTNSFANDVRVHTSKDFRFNIAAPMATAFPLFGADRERLWAPDWQPTFVWPAPATDRPGMVFTVSHAERRAVWVNTDFDPVSGYVRYVYVLPDVMTTVITIQLQEQAASTGVHVRYERTSLSAAADQRVREAAQRDALSGPEWAGQIAQYLNPAAVR